MGLNSRILSKQSLGQMQVTGQKETTVGFKANGMARPNFEATRGAESWSEINLTFLEAIPA